MFFFSPLCTLWNIFAIFVFCFSVFGQESLESLKCESFTECGSCLQQLQCVWCSHPKPKSPIANVTSSLSHCIPESPGDIICSEEDLINPRTNGEITENRRLQSKSGGIVQMKPQRIKLALRVGDTYDLHFQYSQAENYPVDLYYIIDNSASMAVHKAKLAELGTKLSETMRRITSDFRIGFGSFIDKRDMPFVSTVPERLTFPCYNNKDCVTPYAFKNHLSLSSDFERFAREVMNAKPSSNLDSPEGGFDAIMQAIVCKEEIGWRPQARHLIMFSTDAQFHIAGDGKLAGVIETNDAKCHMENNHYDGLDYDYPSVSQLNYVAKENNINLIFAVVKARNNNVKRYKMLSKQIENSKADGLDADSKNVINLVVDNYNEIVNSVTIDNNATENIEVKITPHCRNRIGDGCSNIRLGEVVNFTASIKVLKCADDLREPIVISLKPHAINESLIIDLEPICKCKCESPRHPTYQENSTFCTDAGNLVCGICMCKENRHGSQCECDNQYSQNSDETNCRDDKPGAPLCSGLGTCKCGKCECKNNPNSGRKYRGKFCDCDDDSCDKENGELCGGKGTCSCGTCICNAGWTGSSCSCPDNNRTCIREGETEVCSGKGSCNCGKCECSDKYTGTYCDVCPTCKEKCLDIKDCVECTAFKTGIYKDQCQLKCVALDIKTTDEVVVEEGEEDKICRAIDSKKCEIIYKYKYDDLKNLIVTVRREKICEPDLLVWALTVIGSILLIGLLTLLIWKIITMIHDKREYVKFENEQKKSLWHTNQNPLYKNATTTFENPFYPQ